MVTTKNQIISEIKRYIQFLGGQIKIDKIILFGSYAKGQATDESDIDVAVISSQLGKAPLLEKMKLFEWRSDADVVADIQPVPIGLDDYETSTNFFCPVCKEKITKLTGWHSHHMVWRSLGGSDLQENRVLLHPNCHAQVHSLGFDLPDTPRKGTLRSTKHYISHFIT